MFFSDKTPTLFSIRLLYAMLLTLAQGAMLSGCPSHSALMVGQVEQQTSDQQQVEKILSALQVTEERMAKAQSNNVELYSPQQMYQARSALAEARRYSKRFQSDPESVNSSISLFFGDSMGGKALSLIAQANDALTRAEDNKQQADAIFADANENFVWLKKFQAPVHFRYEYQDLERTQQRLVEYVANGQSDKATQGLPRLLLEQRALETAAAQRFYLYELGERVDWQEHAAVGRYASLSYSNALSSLNKAKAVVAQNTRDEAAILAAKQEAEFAFEIANAVAVDMQKLVNMDRKEMERWLLLLTTKLNAMATVIGANDVRNHELMTQVDLLTAAAQQGSTAPVAVTQPETRPDATVVADKPAQKSEEQVMSERMAELEQSLQDKVKALSEQLQAMKAANKSAQAESQVMPVEATTEKLTETRTETQ